MSSTNPLTVPGGWGKDNSTPGEEKVSSNSHFVTMTSKGLTRTALGGPETVPRTAAGVVSESGEIVDESGKAIGKIADAKDPESLVGNTVAATGDVVSSSGDVVGKASLQDEYTTEPSKGGKKSGDGNVLGKAKSAAKTAENIRGSAGSALESAGNLPNVENDPRDSGDHKDGKDTSCSSQDKNKPADTGDSRAHAANDSVEPETTAEAVEEKQPQSIQLEDNDGSDEKKSGKFCENVTTTGKNKEEKGTVEGDEKNVESSAGVSAKDKAHNSQSPDRVGEGNDKDVVGNEKAANSSPDVSTKDKGPDESLAVQSPAPVSEGDGDEDIEGDKKAAESDAGASTKDKVQEGSLAVQSPAPIGEGDDGGVDGHEKAAESLDARSPSTISQGHEKDLESAPEPTEESAEETTDKNLESAPEPTEEPAEETTKGPVEETAKEHVKGVTKEPSEAQDDAQTSAEAEGPAGDEAGGAKDSTEGPKSEHEEDAAKETEQGDGEKEEEGEPRDYSILKGTKVNKAGNLFNSNGDIIGRLIEGEVKQLIGKTADEQGNIWNNSGKVVGKAEPVPDAEREDSKDFAPFENFPDAIVEADGRVMSDGKQVGTVIEGDPKRLKGSRVDEDGDILDRRGNVVGRAEAWDEPEQEVQQELDRSILAGKRVNKAGNVVDSSGVIYGRVVEGNVSALVGRMCNKQGHIMSESGEVVGKAELVSEHEREGSREGPFAELVGCTVTKDGKVVTPSGDVVGRLTSGDGKTLFGRSVDEDGDVLDRNGNVLGKAERWEEPEVEKKKNPLSDRKVNREGNVVDEDGNVVGKLVSGDLIICSGKEIDDDGDVINSKGVTVGHVRLLEDIVPEPEPEPEPEPTESEEDKEKRLQAEKDRKLAGQLSAAVEQSLDKIRPICKMITDKIDRAERTPKEELDEEQLVKDVKPLIEEGGKILTETNGVIRGLDPDGRIQRNAKHKAASRDGSPEEHHLAEVLKELTGTVSQTIDNAKRKIEGMPHAKKELNPLWGLLSEPLFQILAAVGLLLNGVLGLVGRLLSGLGLGGLVDNLLGGLGLNKLLDSLGLGSALDALTGKKNKKK